MKFSWLTVRQRQEDCCCYCETRMIFGSRVDGKPTPKNFATKEHLRRRTEGGKTTPDNVAYACFDCNTNRGGIDWFTYKSWKMGELSYG